MQRGILFETLSDPRPGHYVLQNSISVTESLEFESWCDAWQAVADRHEALRTGFAWDMLPEPQQLIWERIKHPVQRIDWRDRLPEEVEAELDALRITELRRPFDLARPPLSRVTLVELPDNRFECLWTCHHAILDGRSVSLILEQVFRDYDARIGIGEPVSCADVPSPTDAYRERARFDGGEAGRQFWRTVLDGLVAATPLPDLGEVDPAPDTQSLAPGMCEAILSRESTDHLRDTARKLEVTLHTLLQGAWSILLSRYTGVTDVVFADTRAGRHDLSGDPCEAAGVFIATVPVRAKVPSDKPVAELLTELRQLWVAMRPHELTPLPIILQQAAGLPESARLLDTLVMYDHRRYDAALHSLEPRWNTRQIESRDYAVAPLAIAGFGEPELVLHLSFDRSRYSASVAEQILAHLQTLLVAISARTDIRIGDLAMINTSERHLLSDGPKRQSSHFHSIRYMAPSKRRPISSPTLRPSLPVTSPGATQNSRSEPTSLHTDLVLSVYSPRIGSASACHGLRTC